MRAELVGKRGHTAKAGARTQRDQDLALLAHLLRQFLVLLTADSSRYKSDIRCGNFHLRTFASLTIELVIHQDWHVYDFYLLQYVEEWFTDVEDGYLAASAYGEPFFGKSSCHAEPPLHT